MKYLSTCCALLLSIVSSAQWELTTAIKTRSTFSAVHMGEGLRGYALDMSLSTILRTDDGGHTWQRANNHTITVPNAIHMWNNERGIVVGGGGSVHHTSDGFRTFTTGSVGQFNSQFSVAFANDTLGLAGGQKELISRSTDGGVTWTEVRIGTAISNNVRRLAMPSVDTAYAIVQNVGVLRSIDGGLNWSTILERNGLSGLYFRDARNGTITGASGTILQTADAGITWVDRNSGITQNIRDLSFQGDVGLAASHGGWASRSTDGGLTWNAIRIGETAHACMTLAPTGIGFSGTDGRIYGTTDHGETWELVHMGTYHAVFYALSFANGDTGVVVGERVGNTDSRGLLRTVDGGRNWANVNMVGGRGVHLRPDGIGVQAGGVMGSARTSDLFNNHTTVEVPEAVVNSAWSFGTLDHLLAAGEGQGGVYRTSNGGVSWQHTPMGNTPMYDLHFISDRIGFAVGGGGQVWKSSDAGVTWTQLTNSTSQDQFALFFLNEQIGWTVGGSSGARTTNGGQSWTAMGTVPLNGVMVHFANPDTGYVVGNTGYAARSTDGGASWEYLMPAIENALINAAVFLDGDLVLAGANGDCYRARVACPRVPDVPLVRQRGTTLCTSLPGAPQWYFNGEPLANGDRRCIDAQLSGSYTVVVVDAFGCTSSHSRPFVVSSTGVAHTPADAVWRVAPNPATDHIRILGPDGATAELTLLDLHGRVVRTQRISANEAQLDLSGLAPGLLLLRVRTNASEMYLRLVKQ